MPSRHRRLSAVFGLTAAIALGLFQNTAAWAADQATSPALEVCGQGSAVTQPGSMILTCADDGEIAEDLSWSSWSATSATATGLVSWKDCAADCAHATKWDSASAQLTLTTPVAEPGQGTLFTTAVLHIVGPTPSGFHRDATFDETPLTDLPAPATLPKASARATVTPAAASGTLGYAQIEGFWIDAGGPSGQAETAAAITGAESSFEPGIIQQGVDYCGSGSDRAGWGLWQITCGNSVPDYGTDFQILDPWNNAEAAVAKYDDAGGFSPWTTYEDGAYENYLESVSADTSLTDPGEYVQDGSTPSGTPSSPAADPGSTYGPPMPGTPSVSVTAPSAGALVGDDVTVSASVANAASGASLSTQFAVDGTAIGSPVSGANPSITWDSTALNGVHTLTATTTSSIGGSGTSSGVTVNVRNRYQVAFNASSTNKLYLYGVGTGAIEGSTPVGVAPGTSPAIAELTGGGFEVAFTAANTDQLYLYGVGSGAVDGGTPVGVAAGTSPAIAALPGGGFQVVFSAANTNTLWRYGVGTGSYTGSTPVGLAPGTSPTITTLAGGGYEVAFNAASTDQLYLYGEGDGAVDGGTPVGVATGTSPAITALPGGGFQVVFSAANTNTLWRYGVGDGSYTGSTPDGVAAGTSPSITTLPSGGFEVAFNAASTNQLYLYGNGSDAVAGSTPVGVAAGTSPSITTLGPGGFQVVFAAANTNTLWRYGVGAGSNTGSTPVGLAANTSPAVN